jgi:hypothetical protein
MIQRHFSENLNKIIEQSRLVALRLGYDYISSLHLFIADCQYGKEINLFDFGFGSQEEFKSFLESCKEGESDIFSDAELPLTKELEISINRSPYYQELYANSFIEPAHIFLAAAENKSSVFHSLFPGLSDVFTGVEKYYLDRKTFARYEENYA